MAKAEQPYPDEALLAAYTVGEAAHYLHLPRATVRAWAVGRLAIPSRKPPMLSFLNLIETHVLAATAAKALDLYLARIEWDTSGLAAMLFPFIGKAHADAPRAVMIDPRVAFGRPVLAGTSIPTLAIAKRFKAGESETELARDYGRAESEIEEAIRFELALAA